ncbi:hypothetical protein BD847_1672 [Flavobacterium cutihirudinis]|uniref:Subunit length determinant protein n=1 Tax=Flavobacterium cutihirudinis TaxID=1265740 RepID=A0A3D9FW12_9FLAO|nr:hypothetical protein [Flavobacterium cutihirudinis]RED24933.1 hypothetical protein BD847_1672 [Flavobacterium cutihirudinis]
MSTKVPQNTDQEIDIFQLSKSIGNFFDRVNRNIFRGIQFFVKNWIAVLILVVLGIALGFYLDSSKKSYQNQIVVTPNFESVDYLYAKIDLIQSKIASGDIDFTNKVFGTSGRNAIKKIEIKPVPDVYKFIEDKEQNFELIKLMAEVGEVKKVLEDNITSKNYTFHTITFTSNEEISEKEVVEPLLNYLNKSAYFDAIQKIGYKNLENEIAQNDTIIAQINHVLNGLSGNSKSDKLIYNNENLQLNDIIKTKQKLISEQGKNRFRLISFNKTIKEINSTININENKTVNGNFKIWLPIFFIFIFVLISMFLKFYRKQLALSKASQL